MITRQQTAVGSVTPLTKDGDDMSYGPYPWYNVPANNTSQNIAQQTQATYENYNKIKKFEDIGYFLMSYVVEGGIASKDATYNNQVDVTDIVVSLANNIITSDGTSFKTKIPTAIYYLDYSSDGRFDWGNTHPSGAAGTDYLTIAQVTTDAVGNVDVVTDMRGPIGGLRLKDGIGIPNLNIDGGNFTDTYFYPDYDGGEY